MNRILIILVFSVFPIIVNGQEKKLEADQKEFDEAMGIYYKKNYELAIHAFQNFIQDFPDSELIGRAKYNLAFIYEETNQPDKAIPVFKEILNSKFTEKDASGSLMEQYALYKHRSSAFLADIYLEKENYLVALKYNKLADKKYPYKHFHYVERIDREIYLSLNYSKIYQGLGEYQKSLKYLLPYTFYGRNYIVQYLIMSLDSVYTQAQIQAELRNAIKSLKIKKNKNYASVSFFERNLKIYNRLLYSDINDPNIEEYLKLEGKKVYHKIIELHPLFKHYLE